MEVGQPFAGAFDVDVATLLGSVDRGAYSLLAVRPFEVRLPRVPLVTDKGSDDMAALVTGRRAGTVP
jgi:hypothetical protein